MNETQTTRVEITQEHDRTWTARVYRNSLPLYVTKGSPTKDSAIDSAKRFLQLLRTP